MFQPFEIFRRARPLLVGTLLLAACAPPEGVDGGSDASADGGSTVLPVECGVTAPTACPEPAPRYADVAPIFEARCVVCHDGTQGYWPLDTYRHVADWNDSIRSELLACTMPPPGSGYEIPAGEAEQILTWLRCGYPE